MKIAVFSSKSYDQEYFEKLNKSFNFEFDYFETALNLQTAKLAKGYEVICVFVNDKLNRQVLKTIKEKGVRLIALRCAGYNNVDLEAAKEFNLKVVRVPAYSPEAVAEHAAALILTLNRKTHKAYNRVREGNFSLTNLIGFNLHVKTIGVIGTGQIGTAFSKIMKGFGCRIFAFDLKPSKELEELGVEFKPLEVVMKSADILSLHCPLLPQTYHLINKETLSIMKDSVMIINTSRGALINTADVIDALKSRQIGSLGIDVYEQEENLFFKDLSELVIQDDFILRLNSFPNVLITSHQAFFTKEAMDEITLTTLNNIKDFRDNHNLINEVSM